MKCCFIGHRKIEINEELKHNLTNIIETLIIKDNVKTFVFGSRSEFDSLCHLIVSNLKIYYPDIERVVFTCRNEIGVISQDKNKLEKLILYSFKEKISLCEYEKEIEYKTKYVAGRASYIERNYAMIDESDFCVFYYDENYKPEKRKLSKSDMFEYQPNSGTSLAYKYAKRKNKIIINVFK